MVLSWKEASFGVCWISGSAVWGRGLFPGICEEFADGSVWGRGFFPLPFVAFGSFGTGEGLLWYGICARCAKQAPVVRDAFSGTPCAQNSLFWYRSDIRYRKSPSVVRGAFSGALGAKKGLLWYGRDIRCAEQASLVRE